MEGQFPKGKVRDWILGDENNLHWPQALEISRLLSPLREALLSELVLPAQCPHAFAHSGGPLDVC